IYGWGGSDVLSAGDGHDVIYGGLGADLLRGETGIDLLFGGEGADTLFGAEDHDGLVGGNGADEIHGGDGTDQIDGGPGADQLHGGAGLDYFSYTAADHSGPAGLRDTIHDFETGTDQIIFELDGDISTSEIDILHLSAGGAVANGFWIVVDGTDSAVLADVNGDALPDLEILVIGVTTLTAEDFA
ncbi:MAG TPA: calcium-binding protein, partial [Paracoccus sp. (in: a-proteobacteria)]|nr:calcium-binding protein [Paracoccus sp. (in: a-proteobacteria)]